MCVFFFLHYYYSNLDTEKAFRCILQNKYCAQGYTSNQLSVYILCIETWKVVKSCLSSFENSALQINQQLALHWQSLIGQWLTALWSNGIGHCLIQYILYCRLQYRYCTVL